MSRLRRCAAWAATIVAGLALSGCPGTPVVGGDAGRDATADLVVPCATGQQRCNGTCVDTNSDSNHCGACGQECAAGQRCVAGTCRVSCPTPQVACPAADGGAGLCTDLQTDRANCGACGNACPAGQVCSAGTCMLSCMAGLTDCSGSCRDLQTDRNHCGACDTACASGLACVAGTCVVSCLAGQTDCGGICRDLQTDRNHCGACGNACPAGQVCSAGACALSCASGTMNCSGSCVDTRFDPNHCGACGNACPARPNAAPVCASGTCAFVCNPGYADCDGDPVNGCEVDLNNDPSHCGRCGATCPTGPNAAPVCIAGTCGITCNTGYGNCDGNPANGCEVDFSTDAAHCGACGMTCPTGPNAMPVCTAGTCGITCNTGYGNCDGNPANGCEANFASDPNNCGTCGNVCSLGVCTAGVCGGRCYTGTPRVLVYGPGGTGGSRFFPAGTDVTVASDAMWRSMTTDDFGSYDVIWIDGASCSGSLSSVYGTAEATVSVWGPAIRGRIVVLSGDPDYHGDGGAPRFFQNSLNWLKTMGRNATGGRTSLFFSWGCTMAGSYTPGATGSPERFASVFGSGITGNATNFCAAYTTVAGMTHPVLSGVTTYWSCPMHGGFSTLPSGYTVLATGTPGGTATLAARESPVACIIP